MQACPGVAVTVTYIPHDLLHSAPPGLIARACILPGASNTDPWKICCKASQSCKAFMHVPNWCKKTGSHSCARIRSSFWSSFPSMMSGMIPKSQFGKRRISTAHEWYGPQSETGFPDLQALKAPLSIAKLWHISATISSCCGLAYDTNPCPPRRHEAATSAGPPIGVPW